MQILDVKMRLKPHLYSITLATSMSQSPMLKPRSSDLRCSSPGLRSPTFDSMIFDAQAQIFHIRAPMLEPRLSISDLRC